MAKKIEQPEQPEIIRHVIRKIGRPPIVIEETREQMESRVSKQ